MQVSVKNKIIISQKKIKLDMSQANSYNFPINPNHIAKGIESSAQFCKYKRYTTVVAS